MPSTSATLLEENMNVQMHPFVDGDATYKEFFDRLDRKEEFTLARLRSEAFLDYAEHGLPNKKVELWKYTDLKASLTKPAPLAAFPPEGVWSAADIEPYPFSKCGAINIDIVNGYFDRQHSLPQSIPDGVLISSIADDPEALKLFVESTLKVSGTKKDVVCALNTAFFSSAIVVRVADGTKLDRPIHVRYFNAGSDPMAVFGRVLFVVEKDASATILESVEGLSAFTFQCNTVTEVIAGAGSDVTHLRLADGYSARPALSVLAVSLGQNSAFKSVNVAANTELGRHQIFVEFTGKDASVILNGVTALRGKQHYDVTLYVDHAVPDGISRELFKTVVDGQATGIFQGKIAVRKHAQKTDGKMRSSALLLSDEATMNNKPELEIFADDVVCGHGATCGELDEDLLFYLMSRGLSPAMAERLMIEAFLGEVVQTIELEAARDAVAEFVGGWLRERNGTRSARRVAHP
jgi:Fe-S cluster assembly protein SufD